MELVPLDGNVGEIKSVAYVDSLIGKLNNRKQRAETELAQCNAALAALQANPEVANLLELISKVGR